MEKSIIELRSIIQNDKNCPKINYDRDFDTLKRANLSILRLLESYRDNYTENTQKQDEIDEFLQQQITNLQRSNSSLEALLLQI